MNDLQQSKILLEKKIELTKGNIARKEKEYKRLRDEIEEVDEIIVNLNRELWADEFALSAVNKEISEIPTLAVQKTNPLFKTFAKGIAVVFSIFFSLNSIADTIPASAVKVSDKVWVNAKGKIVAHSTPHWVEVKSGFIVKKSDNLYIIDGKEFKPGNKKPLKIKR